MRTIFTLAALALIAGPSIADELKGADAPEHPVGHFADEYRYGGTYKTIRTRSSADCAAICSGDPYCRAWSYTAEGAGVSARCELKQVVGAAEYRPGTTSGLSRRVMDRLALASSAPVEPEVEVAEAEPAPTRDLAVQHLPVGSAPVVEFDARIIAAQTAPAPVQKTLAHKTPASTVIATGKPMQLQDPTAAPLGARSISYQSQSEIVFRGDPSVLGTVQGSYSKLP